MSDLTALGLDVVDESFEDQNVWADSRNSIVNPGSTLAVASQGIVWRSNHATNEIATGDVGGSAPHGGFAIYSLPHGLTSDGPLVCDGMENPLDVCYQNDGLKIAAEDGRKLFAFGGRIDTANSGKVTFLLDGVDINANENDNIDNWQREGEWADNWSFVGVIESSGFQTVELRELRGKDWQQVLLFADQFSVALAAVPLPVAWPLFVSALALMGVAGRRRARSLVS
ncbi:MAG: hypothetical protein KDI68_02015 [Gammaproteobacteria bacterium]|nr:hypothetical protein [Gammaproteobacteria bacterium]